MLQSLHNGATKWFGLALFSLLLLSFVFWGIADVFHDRVNRTTVAHVGPLEISGQQLQGDVQRELSTTRNLTGRSLTMQEALETGLVTRALDTLISRALLEQEAQRIGLRVPDSVVIDKVRSYPEFKKESDGSFDAEAFKQALASVGMSEQTFLLDQRVSMAREELAQAATAAAIAPSLLQKALAAAAAQRRTVETYRVKLSDQPAPTAPDDKMLQDYLAAHQDAFTTPAFRTLSFVHISGADVADEIAVSDDEIAQAFATQKDQLATPETRSFVQVLTTDEAKAKAVAAAANASHDLSGAAKAAGLSPLPLPDVKKDDLPGELQADAFKLSKGEVAQPVQSALGWHILQATAVTPGHAATLAATHDKLRDDLKAQKTADLLVKRSQQIDDQLSSGASLDEVTGNYKLVTQQIPAVSAEGKDDKGNAVGTLPPQALKAAFALGEGKTSDLITVKGPTGGEEYYIVHADTVTASHVPELAAIRPQVLSAWQQDEKRKSAQAMTDKLMAALKDGKPYEAVAHDFKVEASVEKDLTQGGVLPNYLPDDYTKALFALKQGDVGQTSLGKEGITVVRVRAVTQPVSVADAKPSGDTQTQEAQQDEAAAGLFAAYTASLRKRYPVTINEGAIPALFVDKTQQDY